MADDQDAHTDTYLFRPRQFLGPPLTVAPPKAGLVSANVQFIIRDLHIKADDRRAAAEISKHCGLDTFNTVTETRENKATGRKGTLVSIAFYVPEAEAATDETGEALENHARLLVERFMGILSFYAGVKVSGIHAQTTRVSGDGKFAARLEVAERTEAPRAEFTLPDKPFGGRVPSDSVFNALFWLRRGMAERDPLETYSSLMVCLQCLAREKVSLPPAVRKCPACGNEIGAGPPAITAQVRHLVVELLGVEQPLFERIWKARNAIVAHGNRTVSADVFLELTELKLDAITLCYRALNLTLGLLDEDARAPHRSLFATSAMMYLD